MFFNFMKIYSPNILKKFTGFYLIMNQKLNKNVRNSQKAKKKKIEAQFLKQINVE